MIKDRDIEDGNHEAPDALRTTGPQSMLDQLKAYPADDAECAFELKLPLSVLMALMLRSEETQDSPQSLILNALDDAGY